MKDNAIDELLHRVHLTEAALHDRVLAVLKTLPADVLDDLRSDPHFQITQERRTGAQGTQVWIDFPQADRKGSRVVVLRAKLASCGERFARYVIAHELAHAFLWNGGWEEITDREEAADALAASWGHDRPLSFSD